MASPGLGGGRFADAVFLADLTTRLMLAAHCFIWRFGGRGLFEPEDLVQDVLALYLGSRNELGYDLLKGELHTFLSTVMKRMLFKQLRRRRKFFKGSTDDPTAEPIADKDSVQNYEDKRFIEELHKFLESKPELLKLFESLEKILQDKEVGGRINKVLAEHQGRTVDEIVAARKRLRRLVKKLS